MFYKSDPLFMLVERLVNRMGLISTLVNKLAGVMIPHAIAKAFEWCPLQAYPYFCYTDFCLGVYCGERVVGTTKYCLYTEKDIYTPQPGCQGDAGACQSCSSISSPCAVPVCSTCECPT